MPSKSKKPIIITSKTCHVCDSQKKINRKYGFEDKFSVADVQTEAGQRALKEAEAHGYKVRGVPTFFCADYSCKDEGLRGPKLLKAFLKDNEKALKQGNKSQTAKAEPADGSKRSIALWIALPVLSVFVIAMLIWAI